MTTIALDLRHAVRLTLRQPAFALGIVVMLALGIGTTTALFSVVHGVLLKPLVFPEPDRLVEIFGAIPERNLDTISLTEANFWDLRDMNRAFEEVGARHGASFSLTGVDAPERLRGAQVSAGFFRSLGIQPVAGRDHINIIASARNQQGFLLRIKCSSKTNSGVLAWLLPLIHQHPRMAHCARRRRLTSLRFLSE